MDRDNALPLVPIITFGITAYRGYNFIQKLDKARDIIARANPQSDESSKSGDISKSNKSDKNQTAQEVLKDKDGKVNREFPSQWRDKTLKEIEKAAKSGDASARKAKKLLNDKRFSKGDNRK